jgi:hypothetical protein
VNPVAGLPATVEVFKTEEKGSDVNIATLLLLDAFDHDADAFVIVSNDSDLIMPIEVVRSRFGRHVGLLSPYPRASRRFQQVVSFNRHIRPRALAACQLSPAVTDVHGTIHRPAGW